MPKLLPTVAHTHPSWCQTQDCHAASGGPHASAVVTVDGMSLRLIGGGRDPKVELIIGPAGAERYRGTMSTTSSGDLRDTLAALLLAAKVGR